MRDSKISHIIQVRRNKNLFHREMLIEKTGMTFRTRKIINDFSIKESLKILENSSFIISIIKTTV